MEFVYTCNTFRMSGVTAYWCLQRRLPIRFFELIQDLHIQYSYRPADDEVEGIILVIPPYGQRNWNETCLQISRMRGLKHIRFDIYIQAPHIYWTHENIFFLPVEELGHKLRTEVRVNWTKNATVPNV
ncbi:hypothetical protein IQ06DRAFT_96227 [Phaeosphaeriaceae sp. SRC1lsM3a]|nr:hypothetical protein IQ06DRAFT_96227 [Stagonospora sp. SRC1lsM3a]